MVLTQIAISAGDPQGIGPEVSLVAAADLLRRHEDLGCRLHGPLDLLQALSSELKLDLPWARLELVDQPFVAAGPAPSAAGGAAALAALESAFADVQSGRCQALVTAPLAKEAVAQVAPGFTGHTEWIGERLQARPLMMLAHADLRVALVTTHLPLARVPEAITSAAVQESLAILARDLRAKFGISAPRIAVLGLNPHAGEGGQLGDEEIRVISPAIERARGPGLTIAGPFPADSFFVPQRLAQFDAVLAMYHDQGLIPVKMSGFYRTVNISLGLPIIRCSPDHGTGFDLRASGRRADPGSMIAALELALKLAREARPR